MPILIPSKNIYQKQNPKVRDNVIERIEVQAQEIVQDNNYKDIVYNEKITTVPTISDVKFEDALTYTAQAGNKHYYYSRVEIRPEYCNIDKIKIPILSGNHFVKSILLGMDKEIGEPNIKYSISGERETGNTNGDYNLDRDGQYFGTSYVPKETFVDIFSIKEEDLTIEENTHHELSLSVLDETNLGEITKYEIVLENGIEYIIIKDLKILIGIRKGKVYGETIVGTSPSEYDYIICEGTYEYLKPKHVEITIYGTTIGIDLNEKTVYINGGNTKKVHSVSGNELMQTTNYFVDKDGVTHNAIEHAYSNVQNKYKDGKETATILCDISDYYDYDTKDKVICIKNSTGKMSFKEYDQVIPMVFGADGKDKPMSLYLDGTPKVFAVLGTKMYYDGAVWQELSLQEIDKSEIK